MNFPCNACGACCRKVGPALQGLRSAGVEVNFPHDINPDGSCSMLIGNACSIYETRPLVCRVDDMLRLFGMTQQHGYAITIKSCNDLKRAEGREDFL